MRQCLSCNTQFDDALANCPACQNPRSFRVAGPTRLPGAAVGGAVVQGFGAMWSGMWSPEWSPNGVVWAGLGMMAIDLPFMIELFLHYDLMPGFILFVFAALCLGAFGFGLAVFYQQEWSYHWAQVILLGQVFRSVRGIYFHLITVGFGAMDCYYLLTGLLNLCCLVLLVQGYGHPGSRLWIRIMVPAIAVYWVLAGIVMLTIERVVHPDIPGAFASAAAAEGIQRGDDGRVTDSVLCCSWVPPKDWNVVRMPDGEAATPGRGEDGFQTARIELDWSDDSIGTVANDWANDPKQNDGLSASAPVHFTTASGIGGYQVHGAGERMEAEVFFIPGRNHAYYRITVATLGTATAAIDAKAVASSFRLEQGTPKRVGAGGRHHHREDDGDADTGADSP
jgi:hypothetical protein